MRSINLVGAGFRDIAIAGSVAYCEAAAIMPDIAFAASGGGLVGIMWALGRVDDMQELFLNIRNKDVRSFQPLLAFGKSAALYSFAPLWKTLRKLITAKECKNCRFPLYIGVTDMAARVVRRFNMRDLPEGLDPIKVLVASASIPGLVPPVDTWVDSGVGDDHGLLAALKAGADQVIMLMPDSGGNWSHPKNAIAAAYSAIQMLEYSNYQRQKEALQFVAQTGQALPQCEIGANNRLYLSYHPDHQAVKLTEIAPQAAEVPSWDFDWNPAGRVEIIARGWRSAEQALTRL